MLHKLFAEEWERGLRENPESAPATSGDKRYNDRWTDVSLAAIEARDAADRDALARAARDRPQRAVAQPTSSTTTLIAWQLERAVERQKFREYLQPLSHQRRRPERRRHRRSAAVRDQSRTTATGSSAWKRCPSLIEQTIGADAGGREGRQHAAAGADAARAARRSPAQIVDDPAKSPFYEPFAKFPDGVPQAERAGAAGRGAAGHRRAHRAGLSPVRDLLQRRVPAEDARVHRRGRPARRQGLLRLPRRATTRPPT